MRRTIPLAVLAALGSAVVVASCFEAETIEDAPCAVARDCPAPYVCCSKPRLPTLDTPPLSCQLLCDAYLPFLTEGQPCGRRPATQGEMGRKDPCSEGLVCCPSTLTCGRPGACGERPARVEAPSHAACLADPDCPPPEVCCGIDFFNRENGKCTDVAECAAASGWAQPSP